MMRDAPLTGRGRSVCTTCGEPEDFCARLVPASKPCPAWCAQMPAGHAASDPLGGEVVWHSPGRFGAVDIEQCDDGETTPGELSIIVHGADQYLEDVADWSAAAGRLRAIAADLDRAAAWIDQHAPQAPAPSPVGGGA